MLSRGARAKLRRVDLPGSAPAACEEAFARLAAAEARRPFDLSSRPLLRAERLCLSPTPHRLALVVHRPHRRAGASGRTGASALAGAHLTRDLRDGVAEQMRGDPDPSAPSEHADFDYLVLGAGPAGLQLGYYLSTSSHHYCILERAARPGSFFERFPRSRSLISFNKVHTLYDDPELRLRWDWNSLLTDNYSLLFKDFSRRLFPGAEEMLAYLGSFAERFGLAVQYGTTVRRVSRTESGRFLLEDDAGRTYAAPCLVVATGTPEPYIPPIPGIELAEGYEDVSFDPSTFAGQRVLVVGKGNSGFEFAESILDNCALVHLASPTSLRLAWMSRHAGDVRGHYTRVLDAYGLKILDGLLDCTVDSIELTAEGAYAVSVTYRHAEGERECLVYDRVVRATGFRFDNSIFDVSARPELTFDDRLPAMTSSWESVNVPGMYFAGNLMQVRDFKTASSPFIHGFRYNVRTLYRLLRERHEETALPGEELSADPASLTASVIVRASRTAALWSQFSYLCDVIVVDERRGSARWVRELPADYAWQAFVGEDHWYTLSFTWGVWEGDVFRIDRHPSHERADQGAHLHPVLRRFRRGELRAEHHLLEDLLGVYGTAFESGTVLQRGGQDIATYHREQHELPLRRFFELQLPARSGRG